MSGLTDGQPETLRWADSVVWGPRPGALDLLLDGKVAAQCIPGFLSRAECDGLSARAAAVEFGDYEAVSPRIGRVGLTVFEYDRLDKSAYFAAVPEAQRRIDRITDRICDPVQRVQELVRATAPAAHIAVASEEGHGRYFAGLLRRIEDGTLVHVDFAPAEHPSWSVGRITSQVVWNAYLDVPPSDPGIIRIWQKQWTADDDRYKISGSYGYRPEVVAERPCAEITPRAGMLVLINTRHFHQVTPAGGRRLAITASLGRLSQQQLIMWS